jgi:hypothetical protein
MDCDDPPPHDFAEEKEEDHLLPDSSWNISPPRETERSIGSNTNDEEFDYSVFLN